MDVIPPELVPQFQKQAMSGEDISNYNFGFVNDKGHFLDREKALQYGIDSGIIDPQAGKFGALTSTLMSDTSKPGAALEAVANSKPFYSTVENAVANAKQQNGDASQWLGYLKNQPGVKQEELEHLGLDKLQGNVTKDQLIKTVQEGQPQIGETFKGELKFNKNSKYALPEVIRAAKESGDTPGELEMVIANDGKAYSALTKKYPELANDEDWAEKVSKDVFGGDSMPTGTTKYHSYQLPGGENYREMLMTLPVNKQLSDSGYSFNVKHVNEANNIYKSSHWDEPNILAHMRMNDRTIDGQKSLHLEEIQSDWHQAGRKQGYAPTEAEKTAASNQIKEIRQQQQDLLKSRITKTPDGKYSVKMDNGETVRFNDQQSATQVAMMPTGEVRPKWIELDNKAAELGRIASNMERQVPDAPFKKSWHELALKRALFEAASKGYDKLSWTPGEAQAARYDLSKSINTLKYNPETNHVIAFDKGGNQVLNKMNVEPKDLPNVVGKEVADRLMNAEVKDKLIGGAYKVLNNADLKVGGEGMKGFYDKIIPKAVEKLLKEHGVKVKQGGVETARGFDKKYQLMDKNDQHIRDFDSEHDALRWARDNNLKQVYVAEGKAISPKTNPIHYIDIPQSLRDQAMKRGFPLFATGFPIPNNQQEKVKHAS